MKTLTKTVFLILILNCISIQNFINATTIVYSGANGEWSGHIWSLNSSGSPLCSGSTCSPSCNCAWIVNIKHKVTVTSCSGTLTISGGGAVNLTGGTSRLSVTGNLIVTGGSTMLIPASDTLYISGNLTVSSASTITVNGYINIAGNVTTSGSSSVCGTGGGIYTGSLTGPTGTPGWCFAPVTLPVQLLSFDAAYNKFSNLVQTTWVTASEMNNDYFTIERAKDGETYEAIGKVNGAGNSNQFHDYSLYDYSPYKGISYYRLIQTDFDGTNIIYFKVPVEVTGDNDNSGFIVFPNPTTENSIYLTISGERIGDKITFMLKDLLGRILLQESYVVTNKGSTVYQLFTESKLNKGIYFITGFVNNKVSTQKLILN